MALTKKEQVKARDAAMVAAAKIQFGTVTAFLKSAKEALEQIPVDKKAQSHTAVTIGSLVRRTRNEINDALDFSTEIEEWGQEEYEEW